MKKIVLITFFAFLAMSYAHAGHSELTVFTGLNFVQIKNEKTDPFINSVLHSRNVKGRAGYQLGIGVSFGSHFYVQPGAQYTSVGTKEVHTNTISGNEFTDKSRINVLSIPLKVGYRFIDPRDEDVFNIRLFTGINGHFVLSVKHADDSGQIDINKDDFSTAIVNADFGVGVDIWVFTVDLGYQLGLSEAMNNGESAKLNAFYLNAGFRIAFGDK